MPSLVDEMALEAFVRRLAREEAVRPEFTHQRSVEQIAGIPRRQYLRDARDTRFASTKEGRLIIARTADVLSYYELRIQTTSTPGANDSDAEAIAFSRVGARRVSR